MRQEFKNLNLKLNPTDLERWESLKVKSNMTAIKLFRHMMDQKEKEITNEAV